MVLNQEAHYTDEFSDQEPAVDGKCDQARHKEATHSCQVCR